MTGALVAPFGRVSLTRGQMDRVPKQGAFPQKPMGFIDIEIVLRGRKQRLNPGHFFRLFAQMRLHQTRGKFRPKRAQRFQLFWR